MLAGYTLQHVVSPVATRHSPVFFFFFFNTSASSVIFTLSLHDALPILMLGSVLVLMLPLLVWLTPDLRIKKSLLKCNWTIRKRLPRCKMRLKKRLLAFSRRLHARNLFLSQIGRAVQQECRDRSRMPSSA